MHLGILSRSASHVVENTTWRLIVRHAWLARVTCEVVVLVGTSLGLGGSGLVAVVWLLLLVSGEVVWSCVKVLVGLEWLRLVELGWVEFLTVVLVEGIDDLGFFGELVELVCVEIVGVGRWIDVRLIRLFWLWYFLLQALSLLSSHLCLICSLR